MKDKKKRQIALHLPYRPCVGIMLINREGLVWIGRRCNAGRYSNENWQMPQGGIDDGETAAAAAHRELIEETGTEKAEIIAESQRWHQYDLPAELVGTALKGKYRGQKQKWFAMRFIGADGDINIDTAPYGHCPEFDAWRWAHTDEILKLIIPFKRRIYEDIFHEFRSLTK
jgi:putative (di)nucleoside polyphosphate hydrolase